MSEHVDRLRACHRCNTKVLYCCSNIALRSLAELMADALGVAMPTYDAAEVQPS